MRKLIIIFLFALCFAAQAFVPASDIANLNYQGSNFNVGGNASFEAGNLMNIVGSGVAVQDTLTLNADHVNIRAGVEENTSHSRSQTKTAGVTASTSAGGSVGANASQSKNEADSYSKTHVNSQISAGSINSDSQSFTLAGANVEIQNDINLNTQQLTVESVQDTHQSSSKGSSQSVGVTAGGGSINPSSIGAGQNSSSEDSQWVNNPSTLLGGGKVNITADKTTVTGAVVANASRDENGNLQDHGNMNLVTDELIINDLQDHNHTDSKGIDLSAGLSKSGTSSVGLQKDGHNTEQTTFATLGGGTVTKKSGEQHDLTNTNRDLNNTQEITLDQQTGGLNATVTVDHRLLSEGGRKSIQKDFVDSVQHGKEVAQSAKDVASTDQGVLDFFGNVQGYATERQVLAENAANSDQQEKLRGDQQVEGSEQGLQSLSEALTQAQGLEQGAQVALYDGSQLQDNTLALDHTSVNKTQVEGAYHQDGKGIYVNIDQTDMTNSTSTFSTLVHEQTRHRLAQEGQTGSLSRDDQTTLATNHGDRAGEVWNAYSGLAGISTQGSSTQTQWNNANNQSATVQQGTNSIAAISNNDLKARQLNRNEASLLDQAKTNINSKAYLSAEQKNQAIADLNALACAEVNCAAGVSANDPLYEQVSQLQAQGEALKAKGEDIISSLSVYGVEAKASNDDFVYSRLDQMDDLITSNEQTVARTGQVTQGIAGAAEAADGVALSGTGLGAVIGVPLAGLGAYDMADASDKLGTPHSYQSGQNVLNSLSLDTHGGDISPAKDAAIDLGINAALTAGAAKVAKHADDIVDSVKSVFKKTDVELPRNGSHIGSNGSYNAEGDFDGQIPSEIKAIQQAQDADRQLAQQNNWLDANGNTWWPDNTKGYDKVPGSEKPAQHYQGEEISRYVEGNSNNYDPKMRSEERRVGKECK